MMAFVAIAGSGLSLILEALVLLLLSLTSPGLPSTQNTATTPPTSVSPALPRLQPASWQQVEAVAVRQARQGHVALLQGATARPACAASFACRLVLHPKTTDNLCTHLARLGSLSCRRSGSAPAPLAGWLPGDRGKMRPESPPIPEIARASQNPDRLGDTPHLLRWPTARPQGPLPAIVHRAAPQLLVLPCVWLGNGRNAIG